MLMTSCGNVSGSDNSAEDMTTTTQTSASETVETDEEISGCKDNDSSEISRSSANNTDPCAALNDNDIDRLANAENISEIKDLMQRTSGHLKYYEVDTDEFDYCFDLLCNQEKQFIITEFQGKKYLCFIYLFSSYGNVMDEITDVKKTYSGNNIDLEISIKSHKLKHDIDGCFPDMTYCNCIIELDNDIQKMTLDGNSEYNTFTEYEGGIFYVGDKCGVCDKDLNIFVPVRYDMIRDYSIYGNRREPIAEYYYIFDENGGGLMDMDYNIILDTSLKLINHCYINDDKFVVMDYNDAPLEESTIRLINSKGEDLREPINGFIDSGYNGNAFVSNYAHQAVFERMKEGELSMLEGVLDEDLNEVIPPIYESVTMFFEENEHQFYVVEDENGKCAVAGTDGELKTGFDYNEIYDCWTDYERKYIRPLEYKD